MKKVTIFLFLLTSVHLNLLSQINSGVGEFKHEIPPQIKNCISPKEYLKVQRIIKRNLRFKVKQPKHHKSLQSGVMFDFPMSYSGTDCHYYNISNYVDQNTAAGSILDYHCGSITYDGHNGTDLYTWPFDFWKMDNTLVSIVAAANGTIIAKADGNFDRNCAAGSSPANYVILQHSDGSQSWYWHMKSGTVTTLPIGTVVTVGTFLGFVGSSGSSTAPHLHFEVHDASNAVIDPFYYNGGCNQFNNSTWWNNQIPYYEGQLAQVSTHLHAIQFASCPTTTYSNENKCFRPVLDTLFVYIFGYNSSSNAPTIIIKRADGTTYYTSTGGSGTNNAFYYYWYFILPNGSQSGQWTASATFNSQTCSSNFYVGTLASTINATICADSSYFYNGTNLNTSGIYSDTISNSYGCDSIITLNLTVNSITIPIIDGGAGTWTWTGTQNPNWFNRCNWDKGTLPDLLSDVVIPGSTTFNPTITGVTANCKTITTNTASGGKTTIDITNGGALNINQ